MLWIVIPALKETNMNFHELAEKLRKIDESQTLMESFETHSFEKNNFTNFSTSGTPAKNASGASTPVQECGDMPGMMNMAHAMPGMQPPQQDSVSMNVSMNAQGKGGIRDLMNVLKNIEDAAQHAPHYSPVDNEPIELPDLDGAIEIDGPIGDIEMDHGEHDDLHQGEHHGDVEIIDSEAQPAERSAVSPEQKIKAAAAASISDDDMDENYANRPDVRHQGIDYMTKTLSGGLNKQHQQNVRPGQPAGVNSLREGGLLDQLANLYQEVKLREGIIREEGLDPFGPPGRGSYGPVVAAPSGPKMPDQSVNRIPQNVKPQADRPGLDPKGDPKLYDIQAWLRKNGYKDSYGQPIKPDGVNGDRTKFAYDQAMNAHAQTQDLQNPDTASTAQKIGTSIGSGIDWIETAWRNLKKGFTSSSPSAPPSMNESNEIISLNKKLNG